MAYSLVRLGVFAISFAALLAATVVWWLAALIAAAISFCVAYIFFGKLRDAVALELSQRRASPSSEEDDIVF
jgi:divalent metal cation (Fe/Co/Zn/Cd) transporter